VKYKLYFDEYVRQNEIKDLNALVAFSGDVLGKDVSDSEREFDAEQKFNEANMNRAFRAGVAGCLRHA